MPYVFTQLSGFAGLLRFEGTDSAANFYNEVAKIAGVQTGTDPEAVLKSILPTGWVPIYCADSQGTRDDIFDQFKKLGWVGTKWSRSPFLSTAGTNSKGMNKWRYGIYFNLNDAPLDLINKAKKECSTDARILNQRMTKTLAILTDARHQMKTYGGPADKTKPATFAALALTAIPVTVDFCGSSTEAKPSEFVVPKGQTPPPPQDQPPPPPQDQPPPPPPDQQIVPTETPWYKKWWVWAIAGTGVLAVVSGTIIVIRRRRQP